MPGSAKPPLYRMLDEVCREIDALDLQRDAPAMLEQIRRARPDFATRLDAATAALEAKGRTRASARTATHLVAVAMASFVISKVKEIPAMVKTLVDAANDRSTDAAVRCAVLGALAYVVQPRDIIPDDAPGGYGFVDDAVLLRTGLIEYLNLLPPNPTQDDVNRNALESFASLVPIAVLPA